MTALKFYLLCFMIAAPQGALGSVAHSHSGAAVSRVAPDENSLSLPPDSAFVEERVRYLHFKVNTGSQFEIDYNTTEDCLSEAILRGIPAFRIDANFKQCQFSPVHTPICNKWEGDWLIYIRKDMLTDGSPSDNATFPVELFQMFLPDDVVRYYRIESPTILEFGNLRGGVSGTSPAELLQYFTIYGKLSIYSDSLVLADPSCYTTSSCSEIFVTIAPEIPASDLLILHDICGQTIQVDSGKSIYVLSHEGIGCQNFPNNYPVPDCWVEFTGAGKIMINVTFVNFRESDHCDGFTMRAVTNRGNGCATRISTDLCDATAPTELTSASGKIRIEFGSSASPTREKYGFNFQVTAA